MRVISPAARRLTTAQKPLVENQLAASVQDARLLELSRALTKEYGAHTIYQRALTDIRDGLKPVTRRIMWACFVSGYQPEKPMIKSARVVGDVIGKYHPHGDQAIYDAMETSVRKMAQPLLARGGNWGSLTDGKAAMRYTETRLTKYAAQVLLSREYLKVTPMVPNYDGKDEEPLYLPALLPNLLLNGAEGIAVGVRTAIPPLHPEGVLNALTRYLKNSKPLTPAVMLPDVAFNFPIPCDCLASEDDVTAWLRDGLGSMRFGPIYEYDDKKRTIKVTGVPVPFNWQSISEKLLAPPEGKTKRFDFSKFVAHADDITNKNSPSSEFEIKLKSTVEDENMVIGKVLRLFEQTFSAYTSYTIRNGEDDIQFGFATVPNLLMKWANYRIDLERRYQKSRYQELLGQFQHQKLLLFAIAHIDQIIKIVRTSANPQAELQAKLNLTEEQAKTILEIMLRQLTRLSADAIHAKMVELRKEAAQAKAIYEKPVPTLINQIAGPLAKLVGL